MNLIKTYGWHTLEDDGIKNFNWSSDFSVMDVPEDNTSQYNELVMFIGSDRNKKITISYDNYSFECTVTKSWKKYYFPYIPCKSIIIRTEVHRSTSIDDTRNLGVQVAECYLSNKNSPRIYMGEDGVVSIQNLKSLYIDIVYMLHNGIISTLKIKLPSKVVDYKIFSGGKRNICIKLSPDDVKDGSCKIQILKKEEDNINIINVMNRVDYYDFLTLKSSEYYDDNSKKNESLVLEKAKNIPLYIKWFANWKCTFKCNYCKQEILNFLYRNHELNTIPPEKWINAFNKLQPNSLFITGGEPTLYKDLKTVVKEIDPNTMLYLTTNFGPTFKLGDWIDLKSRFSEIFISFHPTQWSSPDDFFNKASEFIRQCNPEKIRIELVKNKNNLSIVPEDKFLEFCNTNKVGYILDTDILTNKSPYIDLNFESSKYVPVNLDYTSQTYNFDETSKDKTRFPVYCVAGWKNIVVDCMGDIYTCLSALDRSKFFGKHALPHYSPIENIFNEGFKLNSKAILCWESFRCDTCDMRYLNNSWIHFNNKLEVALPLPE
jgi:hypothetical protein